MNNLCELIIMNDELEKDNSNQKDYKEIVNQEDEPINNNNEKDNSIFIKNQSLCHEFIAHTNLMLKKNFLVFSRSLVFTIFVLITPILACLLLYFIQFLNDHYSSSFVNLNPDIVSLNHLNKCINPDDCITVGYSVITSLKNAKSPEYIENIMKDLSAQNNLVYGNDTKLLTIGTYDDYINYIENHMNKTLYNILFCIDYFVYDETTIPCNFEYNDQENTKEMYFYTIMYNISNSPNGFMLMPDKPNPTDSQLTRLKITLDEAFLNYFANKTGSNEKKEIKVDLQAYPQSENRLYKNVDVEGSGGSFYFFFPPMFCFVFFLLEIIREKDAKLRKSLLIIGLNNGSFWFSWFVTAIIFCFLTTILLIITGLIFGYQVFYHTPFFINFFLYFFFSLSMVLLAFFLSTILKTLKSGYTVSYSFILIGLVIQAVLSDYLVIYSLYNVDLPGWIRIIIFILNLYPPFNFSKAFDDIATKAAPRFDYNELRWVDGTEYTWSDLFKRIRGKTSLETEYDVPPTYDSFLWMFFNIILFWLLTWYFDNVNESNKGKSVSYWFCFDKNYWCPKNKRTSRIGPILSINENEQTEPESKSNEAGIGSVINEKKKVLLKEENADSINNNNERNNDVNGINIIGVSKDYYLSQKLPCSKKKVLHALHPLYLHVPFGELFTLLGHNGAGKSTLLNILTGNSSPTSGNAKIAQYDLFSGLHSMIGLCPQHDILWDELTAKEHIEIYCKLRSK